MVIKLSVYASHVGKAEGIVWEGEGHQIIARYFVQKSIRWSTPTVSVNNVVLGSRSKATKHTQITK